MAVVLRWFAQALVGQFGVTAARRVDWANDTIKVVLLDDSYTPDQDAHDFYNDVTGSELGEEGGYAPGGNELTGKSVSYEGAGNIVRLKAEDIEWIEAAFSARYAVIYKDTGNPATSPILGWIDFGEDKVVSLGVFKIEWDAVEGALRVVVGA